MKLVEELREYLTEPASDEEEVTVEYVARRRAALLEALEEHENAARDAGDRGYVLNLAAAQLLSGNRLLRVLRSARGPLRSGVAFAATDDRLAEFEDMLLRRLCQLGQSRRLSGTARYEINRIADSLRRAVFLGDGLEVRRYAFELRLVRRGGTRTRLGETFLSLPSQDAGRFCLLLEAAQTAGDYDPWRTTPELIQWLCETPRREFFRDPDDDETPSGGWGWVVRLEGLGLLQITNDEEGPFTYVTIPEPSLAFLRDVAAGRDTPLSSLASALLEEERSESIALALPALERVQREGAVAQIERHTRLVVHEFRNALVPMRASFNALMRAWPPGAGNGDATQHRQRVEQGMSRMFSFLGELEQAANLASALPTVFELAAVIHEAVAAVRSDHQIEAAVTVAEGLRVSGDRSRFVLALVNVLRNAAQVSERPIARVQIVATVNASGERVVVQVDDDGPGVADEDRLLVFERGFTRRPGGNGIGLALVREVIVAEMNGDARCEAGDLGGARFVLVVPLESRSAR